MFIVRSNREINQVEIQWQIHANNNKLMIREIVCIRIQCVSKGRQAGDGRYRQRRRRN